MKTNVLLYIAVLVGIITGVSNNHGLISKEIYDAILTLLMLICVIIIVLQMKGKNKNKKY